MSKAAVAAILNLGHGILPGTPENGRAFFEAGKSVMERIGATAEPDPGHWSQRLRWSIRLALCLSTPTLNCFG